MKIALFAFVLVLFSSTFELEKRSLLDNKIEILIPKEFKQMSQELINIKYPGKNRPKLILTDDDGTTNIAFSLTDSPADSTVIEQYKDAIKASFKKSFPTAVWKKDGVTKINGKKVGFLKLISEAKDQKMYNYLFLTDIDGKLLIGTFNCTEKSLSQWEEISDEIVNSLNIK